MTQQEEILYAKFRAFKIAMKKHNIPLPDGWNLWSNFKLDVTLPDYERCRFSYIEGPYEDKSSYGWIEQLPNRNKSYPEYSNWKNMRARCSAPCLAGVRDYQHKGITVCDRWNDFALFYKDMGPKPTPKHSIDRIDNSKGYNPENCRWADDTIQARNRGKVKTLTVQGFTGCIPEIAEHFNLNPNSIHKHMQAGKTIEEAVASLQTIRTITYKGHTMTKGKWADFLGVTRSALYYRFSKYNTLDEVFEIYDIVKST